MCRRCSMWRCTPTPTAKTASTAARRWASCRSCWRWRCFLPLRDAAVPARRRAGATGRRPCQRRCALRCAPGAAHALAERAAGWPGGGRTGWVKGAAAWLRPARSGAPACAGGGAHRQADTIGGGHLEWQAIAQALVAQRQHWPPGGPRLPLQLGAVGQCCGGVVGCCLRIACAERARQLAPAAVA